jgi:glycosyltransferase involved in cell wall biosynthesis
MTARIADRAVVVIPAHNEVVELPSSLTAVLAAARAVGSPVAVVVVLDACDDGSASLIDRFGGDVHFLEIEARSVGSARAAGFAYARSLPDLVAVDESLIWYATTDADSRVDPDWLAAQMRHDADMVLGVVRVGGWRDIPAAAARRYLAGYRSKTHPDGGSHQHVHGANMGFRAEAYWRVGGFAAVASDEDVELVNRFETAALRIARDPRLSVVTSGRHAGRAPGGFAAHLRSLIAYPSAEPV